MSDRPTSKAGTWYPAESENLRRDIKEYIADAPQAENVVAAVVPHAGLAFSGSTAGKAYGAILNSRTRVDTFIIFGAVHTEFLQRPAIWTQGEWETPIAKLKVDDELAAALIEAGVGDDNESPHYGDNAIELQTPFIACCFPGVKIVPIAVPPDKSAQETGTKAWEVCASSKKNVIAIGSSDLTHYGASFGLTPAGTGPQAVQWCKENDRALLEAASSIDLSQIVAIASRDRSACGAGAICATAAFAKAAGAASGKVLEHITSHDIMPDTVAEHFVAYASILYEKQG